MQYPSPRAELPGADSDWIELRINAPADGTYGDGALTITLDTQNGGQGPHFSWTSNLGVDAVYVKGGSNGNLYTYDPPMEDTGDGFLHSPVNPQNGKFYGLSHLLFCYDIEPPAVEVVKGGDTLSKVGDPVTYTFDVTNTGGTPLALVSVIDTLLGDLTAQAAVGGCDDLPIAGTCHFEVQRVVQPGDPDPLPNTVTVVYRSDDRYRRRRIRLGRSRGQSLPAVDRVRQGRRHRSVEDRGRRDVHAHPAQHELGR